MMTTSADTKLGRLRFKRRVRREMIDTTERTIERLKSHVRDLKKQVKELSREIYDEMANVSVAIPVAAGTRDPLLSMAEREREARLAMAVSRM